jgi:hypothetical protein
LKQKRLGKLRRKFFHLTLSLPLNVDGNPSKKAAAIVKAARLEARRLAEKLAIVSDRGGRRQPPPAISPT